MTTTRSDQSSETAWSGSRPAFEDVDPLDYEIFAGTTASEDELETARAAALRVVGSSSRREAVERAIQAFTGSAERAMAERSFHPILLYAGAARSPRVEDRARLLQSLERAVVAVILWDELDETERDVLLGPWARLADRAMTDRA